MKKGLECNLAGLGNDEIKKQIILASPLIILQKRSQLRRPVWPGDRNRTSSSPHPTAHQTQKNSGLTSCETCFVEQQSEILPCIMQMWPLLSSIRNSCSQATRTLPLLPAEHHPRPDFHLCGCRGGGQGHTSAQHPPHSQPVPTASLIRRMCVVS